MELTDGLGRHFSYLRLSITDQCNFRCQYCLPHGYQKTNAIAFLTKAEIIRLAQAMAGLGIWKIRLTGGEPTVRHDFTEIVTALAQVEGIHKIATTTNGYNLARNAAIWHTAGITNLNVSVDSLSSEKFHQITGHDKLHDVLAGVTAAQETGIPAIKINTVLLKDINDNEFEDFLAWAYREPLSLRFIELMQTGDNLDYFKRHHLRADILRERLEQSGWTIQPRTVDAGPATVYTHPDYHGTIGLIAPYAKDFCTNCNRLRVTARGDLRLCLFGELSHSLRDLLQDDDQIDALQTRICRLLPIKKPAHFLHEGLTGLTPHLASLGG